MSASAAAHAVLAEACAPFVTEGQPAEVTRYQVWSLIHGYSSLALANKYASAGFSQKNCRRFCRCSMNSN
ncbi:MAG: hypothetical protein MO846_06900 [Candidatus Devosia symbiotica]|nr:hypothetical protein [Candidatus Devosia symbiotica]